VVVIDSEVPFAELLAAVVSRCDQRGGSRAFDYHGIPNPPGDASDIGAKELGVRIPRVFLDRFDVFSRFQIRDASAGSHCRP
jgi:hypothetical protein